MKHKNVITEIYTWAQHKPDITGVFLVGSYDRGDAVPESDIDLVILTYEPKRYLDDVSWLLYFGVPESVEHEDWGNVQSLRVFYTDGPEVEFGITTPDWASHPVPQSTQDVLKGGMRLLFDRMGQLSQAIEKIPNHLFHTRPETRGGIFS